MGHKEMGFRLDAYNLACLREVIGGLQSRYLQSASCLPCKMEATTNRENTSVCFCKDVKVIVMAVAKARTKRGQNPP